jgi:hypothetical protein
LVVDPAPAPVHLLPRVTRKPRNGAEILLDTGPRCGAEIVAALGGAVGRGAPGLWRVPWAGQGEAARLRELPDLCPKFFDMGDRRGLVRGVLFGDALNDPGNPAAKPQGEGSPPQKRRHFQSDEICWRTNNSIHNGADDRTGLAPQTAPTKRSGGRRSPTAVPEVDRGLPDALKLVPNPPIGV